MQTPGQRIRSARELAGMNQGELAKKVGITQATLSEIETGESKLPSAPVLVKMSEILGKSARWIVFGEDGDVTIPSEREVELLKAFRQMPDDAKSALMQTAQALATKKD